MCKKHLLHIQADRLEVRENIACHHLVSACQMMFIWLTAGIFGPKFELLLSQHEAILDVWNNEKKILGITPQDTEIPF